jgi:hypothetical protein
MPEVTALPNKGSEWQEQWAVNVKCIDGADAGTEAVYKTTTVGGIQAIVGLIDACATASTAASMAARCRRSCTSRRTLTRTVSTAKSGRRC